MVRPFGRSAQNRPSALLNLSLLTGSPPRTMIPPQHWDLGGTLISPDVGRRLVLEMGVVVEKSFLLGDDLQDRSGIGKANLRVL